MGEKVNLTSKKPGETRVHLFSKKRRNESSRSSSLSPPSPIGQILHLQQTRGNQAVQRLLKSGTIKAKFTIGRPNDKYEQEADRVADQVMRMPEQEGSLVTGHWSLGKREKESSLVNGHSSLVQRQSTCPECPEREEIQTKSIAEQITPLVQRQVVPEEEEAPVQTKLIQRQAIEEEEEPLQAKPTNNQTTAVTSNIESSINSLKGGGQPLPESTRSYFEPRFGADFSQVRVHMDSHAAEASKSINAKAFTTGQNVVFGAGQYSPETSAGKQLIAHELTHVVQQNGKGVESDTSEKSLDVPSTYRAKRIQRNELPGSDPGNQTVATSTEDAVDYSSIDVTRLTHIRLHNQIRENQRWLDENPAVLIEWGERSDFQSRLQAERQRRVEMGHLWLESETEITSPLIELSPVEQPIVAIISVPLPNTDRAPFNLGNTLLMTYNQWQSHPKRVERGVLAGLMGARGAIPSFEANLPSTFAQSLTNNRETSWRGDIGELAYRHRLPMGRLLYENLNVRRWTNSLGQQQRGNFPIWDLRARLTGSLFQAKTSIQELQRSRIGFFREGYGDIQGTRRPGLFGRAVSEIYPGLAANVAQELARNRGVLVIHAEDVVAFCYDALLRAQPESVGERSYSSYPRLARALEQGSINRVQFNQVLSNLSRRPNQPSVIGMPLSRVELTRLENFRAGLTGTPEAINRQVWPEYLAQTRAGGGLRGTMIAANRAGLTGGGWGTVLVGGTNAIVMLVDPETQFSAESMALSLGSGAIGGYSGGVTQQIVGQNISRVLTQRGLSGSPWVVGGRGVSGGAGGTIAAPIVTVGMMGYEEMTGQTDYTGEDYAARGTRAAVAGGGGGLLAAGITGAIFGSEVPIIGNIIGFGIGVVGYLIIDALVGDEIEEGIRSAYSSAGSNP